MNKIILIKKIFFSAAVQIAVLLFCVQSKNLSAQISIANTTTITENFDAMGTSATASMPSNWKMSVTGAASPTWAAAGNFTAVNAAASTGAPTAGARYNWGTSSTDRAPGIMTSGSFASPN